MDVKIVDNKGDNTVSHLLLKEIKSGAKVAVASAYFSLYAYDALSKVLDKVESFNFIYTKPTFLREEKDLKRQYRLNNNRTPSNYPTFDGNEFEIQLNNQMMSPAIAKNLTKWVKEKAVFKTISDSTKFPKQILVQNENSGDVQLQSEIDFTADGLGITPSNRDASYPIFTNADALVQNSMREFNELWNNQEKAKDITDKVLEQVSLIYKENSPQWLYYITLYNIFSNQLEDLDADKIIKEDTNFKDTVIWNKLYPFQKDGVVGIIDKIEKHNGCILADSVGLGKTFSALAVIKYYELRNDRVLVLAPKKLRDNWTVYAQNDKRNILIDDRFNYDVLNHTDLSRDTGMTGDKNLETVNWSNYDLIVIDESHNFRNNNPHKDRKTRYQRLMEDVIKSGVKTRVLMLSATPVNNKMNDIKNQIAFITEDNDRALQSEGIDSVDQTLRLAQQSYNQWIKLPESQRKTETFIEMVNPDYFQILDSLTIARSRQHIEKYYNIEDMGEFPTRLKPISIKIQIDKLGKFLEMTEVNEILSNLTFSVYQPMSYILPAKRRYYEDLYDTKVKDGRQVFKQTDRETAIVALMKINIFKRLESSISSFNLTIKRLIERQEKTVTILKSNLDNYQEKNNANNEEFDDEQLDTLTVGTDKVQIKLKDIDHTKWLGDLEYDLEILRHLLKQSVLVDEKRDAKMARLIEQIDYKLTHPINPGNKKIIIFSAFADTVEYLYKNLAPKLKKQGINSAMVTGGTSKNKTTMRGVRANDYNEILINFSPKSKDRAKIFPDLQEEIDILFATDVISEGQNLQDCDYLINYDIHWNPVRVIQRFGRIDRIGSVNKEIQLVNFWPNMDLDEYINLEDRVRGRMVILNTSATGEENILDPSSKGMNDLEYRRNQLKALQDEVVNLEDVSGGISITDLTFTEFKTDLSMALKKYGESLEKAPKGMYALAKDTKLTEITSGVIFCFKQHRVFEVDNNSIAPYFLLYVNDYGEAKLHYTSSKKILDIYRKVSLGNDRVYMDLVNQFNQETNDGQDMETYTKLLKQAMDIVMNVQEDSFFDSFFSPGGTVSQQSLDLGTDELELISFLIVKGE